MDHLVQKESQEASPKKFRYGAFLKKDANFWFSVQNNSLANCAPNFDA